MTQKNFVVHNGLTVGNIVLDVASNSITGAVQADIANLNVGALANLGNAGNIKIGGGLQGQLLQTDGNGNLSWYSFNPDSGLSCQVDAFTGAGTTSSYALSLTPVNVNFVSVVIDGVTQLRSTYSLNQNILTIGANLPQLSRMEVTTLVGYGNSALQSTVDSYTGNGNANTYSLSITPPTVGSTTVVVDGVVQMKNSYSLDGSNITLGANLPSGSVLEVTTLEGSNTTPNVANYANYANFAGVVTSSAQPNITSVGNLTTLTVDGTVRAQQIIPTVDNTYTLGNANYRWSNLWMGPGTIYITDSANAANTAELTVYDGILQVNGATGLQANLIAGNTTLTMAPNANIAMSVAGTSNVVVFANDGITVQGNVQATYFKGDGSLLTGIAPTVQVYEFANIASGVSTYLTAQWLADYTPAALATTSVTVSTTPTIIQSFITEAGYPNITVLPVGTIAIHIDITKASGNRIYMVYAAIYKRTTGGTETLIATTGNSDPTSVNTLTSHDLTAYISAPVTLNATDRIVTKIYGSVNSSTASLTLSFDDNTSCGIQLPALPASASQFIPYTGATANVDLGTKTITANKFIGSGANLTNLSAANVSGTVANSTYATSAGTAATVTTAAQPNITSLGTLTSLNVSGNITVSNKQAVNGPAFSAYANSATQTIPTTTQTKVLFQTEEFDTNNNFANSRFTPSVEGYYQLNAEVRVNGSSGTGEMMIVIWKNGSEIKRGTNQQGVQIATDWWAMTVNSLVYANGSSDYFEIAVQQGSGSNRDIAAVNNPSITWFNGAMVRGA